MPGGGESSNQGSSQSQGSGSSYSQSASVSMPYNLQNAAFQALAPFTSNSLQSITDMLSGGQGTNSLLASFLAPYGGSMVAPVTAPQQTTLNNIGSAAGGNYSFNPEVGGILQQLATEAQNPTGFAGSLVNNPTVEQVIQEAEQPITTAFNTQTVPGLQGSLAQAGQRATGNGSSAFDMAFGNASSQEQANLGATAAGIVNPIYQTGLNLAGNASGQFASLGANELQELLGTLNAQALPQLTEQLGINNALSTYNNSVGSILQALGLQVQGEQPVIGYGSESLSNSASFTNEESSGQQSGSSFNFSLPGLL